MFAGVTHALGDRTAAESQSCAVLPRSSVTVTQASKVWPGLPFAVEVPALTALSTAPVTGTLVSRPLSPSPSHVNVTLPIPPVAVMVGGIGRLYGFTAFDGLVHSEQMFALQAWTWKVYDVPLVSPG